MKAPTTLMMLAFALLTSPSTTGAQENAQSYQGGDCSGTVWQSWTDVDIHLVQTRNQSAAMTGPITVIAVTQLRTQYIPGPYVPGHHAEEVGAALGELARLGFETVDVAVYQSGGWVVVGNRNPSAARRVELERSRRAEESRQRQAATRDSQYAAPSSQSRSRTCEAQLYSGLGRPDFQTEAFIDVKDEYVNVVWGNTEVNQGESYSIELTLEDRSGNQRKLKSGQNWVNPGKYRAYLTFYGIRSTSVTLKYRCG